MKRVVLIILVLISLKSFSQTSYAGSYYMANGDTAIHLEGLIDLSGYLWSIEIKFPDTDSIFIFDAGGGNIKYDIGNNLYNYSSIKLDSLPYTINPIFHPLGTKTFISYDPFPHKMFQLKITPTFGDSSTIEYGINFFKK